MSIDLFTTRGVAAAACLCLTMAAAGQSAGGDDGASGARRLYVVDAETDDSKASGRSVGRVLVVDPADGRLVSTIPAGYRPDLVLSPDGSRLYLSYTAYAEPGPDGNRKLLDDGVLEVIDTATQRTLSRVANPNRAYSTLPAYGAGFMALSFDGRWLFQFKMEMLHPRDEGSYYVDTFDTEQNAFLPERADVPECVVGILVPSPRRRERLDVLCSHTHDVRLLTLTPTGAPFDRRPPKLSIPDSGRHTHPGTAFVAPAGDALTVVMPDGRFISAAAGSPRVLRRDVVDAARRRPAAPGVHPARSGDWLAKNTIRWQRATLSPDGRELYLGVTSAAHARTGARPDLESVAVLHAETLERLRTIDLDQPLWSVLLSRDGRTLYGLDAARATLVVIDAATGRQLRAFPNIGTTPILAAER